MNKHPRLARKLRLLYHLKASPDISNNQHLANVLGVSRQSVSKWGAGSRTRPGDAIPDAHFFRLGQIFGIDSYLFTLELEEFEREIRLILNHRNRARMQRPRQVFHHHLPAPSELLPGREAELNALSEAWNPGVANIVQITGVAGVGKTSLIHEWLSRMDADNYRDAEIVLSWSFHPGYGAQISKEPSKEPAYGAAMAFIDWALSLLDESGSGEDDPETRVMGLVRLIRSSRVLLVLDGVQHLQHAYGPGFGQFSDPALALFARELAMENPGLCVLTSRLGSADLKLIGGPRAISIELCGLDPESASELLESFGAYGDAGLMRHAVAMHEGLPLTLGFLGKHLEVVRDGNLAHYMELAPLLEECGEAETAARLAGEYLSGLPRPGQHMFFYLLSLYQRPASLREILKVCRGKPIAGFTREILSLTHTELRYGIFALEKAGIVRVWRKRQGLRLALQGFAGAAIMLEFRRRHPGFWKTGNRLLFARLQDRKTGAGESARGREMRYLAVLHGIRAARWDDAFRLYFRELREGRFDPPPESFRHFDQACLRAFFADPWSRVDAGLGCEASAIDLRSCAAFKLAESGDAGEMIALSRLCLKWYLAHERWDKATALSRLLLDRLVVAGRAGDARRVMKRLRNKLADIENPAATKMIAELSAGFPEACVK